MKLKLGGTYRTRNGDIIIISSKKESKYPFLGYSRCQVLMSWMEDGIHVHKFTGAYDLVEEIMPKITVTYDIEIPADYELVSQIPRISTEGEYILTDYGVRKSDGTYVGKYHILRKKEQTVDIVTLQAGDKFRLPQDDAIFIRMDSVFTKDCIYARQDNTVSHFCQDQKVIKVGY